MMTPPSCVAPSTCLRTGRTRRRPTIRPSASMPCPPLRCMLGHQPDLEDVCAHPAWCQGGLVLKQRRPRGDGRKWCSGHHWPVSQPAGPGARSPGPAARSPPRSGERSTSSSDHRMRAAQLARLRLLPLHVTSQARFHATVPMVSPLRLLSSDQSATTALAVVATTTLGSAAPSQPRPHRRDGARDIRSREDPCALLRH